uniref:Secreted protein n=1 Tax=Strongyloides papillosus TaxID=174720 RepID=A0A0N5CA60_STREA
MNFFKWLRTSAVTCCCNLAIWFRKACCRCLLLHLAAGALAPGLLAPGPLLLGLYLLTINLLSSPKLLEIKDPSDSDTKDLRIISSEFSSTGLTMNELV